MTLHETYMEDVLADFEDYVEEWFDNQEIDELPHDLYELFWKIDDDCFCDDAVTGNGERGYGTWPAHIESFWIDDELMYRLSDYLQETDSLEYFGGQFMRDVPKEERCRWVDTWIRLAYYYWMRDDEMKIVENYCKHIGFELE